jgi:GNAT superfamily N-acetyltransferase
MALLNRIRMKNYGAAVGACKARVMRRDIEIRHVEQLAEIGECHAVMMELRPNLPDVEAFIRQVERQGEQGYRLSAAWSGSRIVGIIGYRLQENFLHGRHVFVDDLVVREEVRGDGVGALLLSAARAYARQQRCGYFVLETGLHKVLAQRFYFRQGMLPYAIGFVETLADPDEQALSWPKPALGR